VVYAVRYGKAAEVAVQTGGTIGDMVEVSGLKAGEKIVLKPSERVRDGTGVSAPSK
jgi:HlyD family secretion protein